MPTDPRLSCSRTEAQIPEFRSPEAEELDRKRKEFGHLQSELAEAELVLATRRSELVAFERRYLAVVGSRYAELDRLEALIAEAAAHRHPADAFARRKAESARTRARESAEAIGDAGRDVAASPFEPTEELKALYRQAAKELHPDLTTDLEEAARRQRAMAELNKAYEQCDGERIQHILHEWRSSPEQVQGDGTAAQLVRVIRRIALARERFDAIKIELEELARGELYRLREQIHQAAIHGRDLLAEIAGHLDVRIDEARASLADAARPGDNHDR